MDLEDVAQLYGTKDKGKLPRIRVLPKFGFTEQWLVSTFMNVADGIL